MILEGMINNYRLNPAIRPTKVSDPFICTGRTLRLPYQNKICEIRVICLPRVTFFLLHWGAQDFKDSAGSKGN